MTSPAYQTTAETLSEAQVRYYRANGFIKIPGIISPDEAARFRAVADRILDASPSRNPGRDVFSQHVNIWQTHPEMSALTLHPNITAIARALSGVPLRLWHDHLLVKRPHNQAPTEFHQDQPYWPHADGPNPLSCWVALNDVPVERGCMSFIPGSHRLTELTAQDLGDANSLFAMAAELAWEPRITLPLRAGDCTFHHGRCAHMAGDNKTDENRYGVAIIYMDQSTTLVDKAHVVTTPLQQSGALKPGDVIAGDLFPVI